MPDMAVLDRFFKMWLKPTVPEWMSWADKHDVHPAIMKYINKNTSDLMPDIGDSENFVPSPRSWTMFSDDIKYMSENSQDPLKELDYLTYLAKGRLGIEIATNFVEFIRTDYQVFDAKEILENFGALEKVFKKMDPTEIEYYNKSIIRYITKQKSVSNIQTKNIYLFMKAIPKELAASFYTQLSDSSQEIAEGLINNPDLKDIKKLVLSVIGCK
jgi:hypothetical protein